MYKHERSLVEKYQGRPFALLGVDEDDSREMLFDAQKQDHLNWRSWWDDGNAIAKQWKVRGWPAFFLIDGKGVVRWQHPGVPDNLKKMDELIEQLVKEAESEGGKQAALSRR